MPGIHHPGRHIHHSAQRLLSLPREEESLSAQRLLSLPRKGNTSLRRGFSASLRRREYLSAQRLLSLPKERMYLSAQRLLSLPREGEYLSAQRLLSLPREEGKYSAQSLSASLGRRESTLRRGFSASLRCYFSFCSRPLFPSQVVIPGRGLCASLLF